MNLAQDDLTAQEAAIVMGVSDSHLRLLLRHARVRGRRFGDRWVVERSVAEAFQRSRSPRGQRKPRRRAL